MLKNCNICRRDLPLEHFRRVRKGSEQRDGRCNRCFNAQRQKLRLAKRSQHLRTFLSKVAAAKSEKLAADLAAEAIRQFGGVQALAREIYESIRSCPPGSRRRITGLQAILRLLEIQPPPSGPDLTAEELHDLPDEELDALLTLARRSCVESFFGQ